MNLSLLETVLLFIEKVVMLWTDTPKLDTVVSNRSSNHPPPPAKLRAVHGFVEVRLVMDLADKTSFLLDADLSHGFGGQNILSLGC